MSRYRVEYEKHPDYLALSSETKRLFDADMRKLERNPYNPSGMRVVAVPPGRTVFEAHAASNRVVIRYRVIEKLVEVHVIVIADPMRR